MFDIPGQPGSVINIQEMIGKGVVTAAEMDKFTKSNILFRDQIWASAAIHLIREHKPNLLLVHFLSLDSVHHQYGPGALAETSAIAFLDSCVGRIVEAVHAAGMDGRAVRCVEATDHAGNIVTAYDRDPARIAESELLVVPRTLPLPPHINS